MNGGLFLHFGIPRASQEAELEKKGSYFDVGEPRGCGAPQANMHTEEGRAGTDPADPKECAACLPAHTAQGLAPADPNPA